MHKILNVVLPLSISGALIAGSLPVFMGRKVTVHDPKSDKDGVSVCLEGPPQRQCYAAPKGFFRNPATRVVELQKDISALLFSAETYGVSGWNIHLALLRPEPVTGLHDFLHMADISLSNQSQHAFWNEPTISEAKTFVTADCVWVPNEGHFGPHRYTISVYILEPFPNVDDGYYYLKDRYMTIQKYDPDKQDVLAAEKREMLARLSRIKPEEKLQRQAHE